MLADQLRFAAIAGRPYPQTDGSVTDCGLGRSATADLAITRRKLGEFRSRSQLSDETYQQLCTLIDDQAAPFGRGYAGCPARSRASPADPDGDCARPASPPQEIVVPPPAASAALVPVADVVDPYRPFRLVPPTPQRRSLAEWLAAFMEDRNILWGELVGGLLVVGCSVALVLSLWQTLERIPLFPFLIFVGITSTLFLTGQYTLQKWRLESTSRGLLAIATLLVPLNFLVLAGLSPRRTRRGSTASSSSLYRSSPSWYIGPPLSCSRAGIRRRGGGGPTPVS